MGPLIVILILVFTLNIGLFVLFIFRKDLLGIYIPALLALSIISLSLNSLALISFASFTLELLLLIVTIESLPTFLYLGYRTSLLELAKSIKIKRSFLLMPIIILGLVWLYAKPFEYYLGGTDPSVYFQQAMHIARTGGLHIHDPIMDEVLNLNPAQTYLHFYDVVQYPFKDNPTPNLFRSAPGFLVNPENLGLGIISPRFLYLYQALLAVSILLFNTQAALYVTPLLMLLSVLILFKVIDNSYNKFIAYSFLIICGSSFPIIWYARQMNSEALALLIFSTLLYVLARKDFLMQITKSSATAIGVGLLIASPLLARLDYLWAMPIIFLWLLISITKINKNIFLLLLIIGGVSLWTVYLAFTYSAPYIRQIIFKSRLIELPSVWSIAFVILIGAMLGYILILKFPLAIRLKIQRAANKTALLVFMQILLFGYFIIRPVFEPSLIDDASNLYKLGWYLTEGVVVSGFVMLPAIIRKNKLHTLLLFLVTEIYLLVFLNHAHIAPIHPWWVRRFIFPIIPVLYLSFFIVLNKINFSFNLFTKNLKLKYLVVALLFLYNLAIVSIGLLNYQALKGSKQILDGLNQQIPANSLLVVTPLIHNYLSGAFTYMYQRPVLPIQPCNNSECIQVQQNTLAMLSQTYSNIYLVTEDYSKVEYLQSQFNFQLYQEQVWVFDDWDNRAEKLSFLTDPKRLMFTIYKVNYINAL